MATRERTTLFLRYREEARSLHRRPLPSDAPAHPELSDGPATAGGSVPNGVFGKNGDATTSSDPTATIVSVSMEPDWVFAYKELKADLAELDKMLEQLGNLYAQHVLPSFGDRDTSHLEQDIRVRSHRLTDLLHTVEQKVRAIASPQAQSSRQHGENHSSSQTFEEDDRDVERVIRRNLQKRFATPLQSLSLNFRKRQKAYLEKLRQLRESYGEDEQLVPVSLHEESASSSRSQTGRVPGLEEAVGPDEVTAHPISETRLLMVENAAVLADERKRELTRVAHNINDLATLVKDIAALVVDQGTVLDRIDYNLEETRLKTMAGTRELRIAENYQRKRHALCCIIILSIGCGIMTVILIYKWTS